MKDLTFEIDRPTPSQNEVLRKYRNVHVRRREQQWWDMMIRSQVKPGTETFLECHITIVRHGERLLDWDNMMAGVKFLMDALVHNRIIVDDNPSVVRTLNQAQVKAKRKHTKTEVLITGVTE